jgi:uncharacterized protein YdhG (YjbR/CyaY superfamily)
MARTRVTSVDDYLASFPPEVRQQLATVRAAIHRALPGAEEVISYQIPAYRLASGVVIYFAGWKRHWSLYPVGPALQAELGAALAKYEVEKDTVRFALGAPVPTALVARIARRRAAESAAAAGKKAKKPKTAKKPKKPKKKA